MKMTWKGSLLAAAALALTLPAAAQTAPVVQQRKDNQQQRIGEGVENGSLTAGETHRLEKQETHLNKEERRMKADGNLTPAERARLQRQQNRMSSEIYRDKHNARTQNTSPTTEVGKRQREQQERIGQGIENGSLTSREASRLEGREAATNGAIHRARADGSVTPQERARINRLQNKNSRAIYRQKHDAQARH